MENLSAVSEDLILDSEKLFIFFGGISGGMAMPPFEFYRSSQILNYSKIFIRDMNQSWYQRGLPNIGNNSYAIGKYIENKIIESQASKIYFIGNSMGGFAALLFCAMIQNGKAIAFAPQTFIDVENRKKYTDNRWSEEIEKLHKTHQISDIYNLKTWLYEKYPEISARIYISDSDRLDVLHAEQLNNFPNIRIFQFPAGGHNVVTKLRDDGLLTEIINSY